MQLSMSIPIQSFCAPALSYSAVCVEESTALSLEVQNQALTRELNEVRQLLANRENEVGILKRKNQILTQRVKEVTDKAEHIAVVEKWLSQIHQSPLEMSPTSPCRHKHKVMEKENQTLRHKVHVLEEQLKVIQCNNQELTRKSHTMKQQMMDMNGIQRDIQMVHQTIHKLQHDLAASLKQRDLAVRQLKETQLHQIQEDRREEYPKYHSRLKTPSICVNQRVFWEDDASRAQEPSGYGPSSPCGPYSPSQSTYPDKPFIFDLE